MEKQKFSRRRFIGTMGAVVAVVAGVGGYLAIPREAAPAPAAPATPAAPSPTPAPAAPSPTPVPAATPAPAAPRTEVTTPEVIATPQVTAPQLGKPIHVGTVYDFTGPLASDGIGGQRAFEMAMTEWEAIFGRLPGGAPEWRQTNIDTIFVAEQAIASIRRLATQENVDIMLAQYIADAGEYPEVAKHELYYVNHDVSGLGEKQVLQSGWNNFLTPAKGGTDTVPAWPDYGLWQAYEGVPADTSYGKNFVYLLNGLVDAGLWTPPNKKYALLEIPVAYTQRIHRVVDILMQLSGWENTVKELVPFGTVEWGPILEKLKADPPGLIIQGDFLAADAAAFQKQFVEDPTPSNVFVQYAPAIPEYIRLAGESSVGAMWHECRGLMHNNNGLAFIERYKNQWGEDPALANSPQQGDFTYSALVTGMAAGGWGTATSRRMAAIFNSGVNYDSGDFMVLGAGGPYAYYPGQLTRPWPMQASNVDLSLSGPVVTYQIKNRKGFPVKRTGVNEEGTVPTHVLIGNRRPTAFWHDTKFGIEETNDPYNSPINRTIMEPDPELFFISGNYPFSADMQNVPDFADENLDPTPPWFSGVSPATWRKVRKY